MLKAVKPKKAANALAANTEFIVGISRRKGVPVSRIKTQSIVLDSCPDPSFFRLVEIVTTTRPCFWTVSRNRVCVE